MRATAGAMRRGSAASSAAADLLFDLEDVLAEVHRGEILRGGRGRRGGLGGSRRRELHRLGSRAQIFQQALLQGLHVGEGLGILGAELLRLGKPAGRAARTSRITSGRGFGASRQERSPAAPSGSAGSSTSSRPCSSRRERQRDANSAARTQGWRASRPIGTCMPIELMGAIIPARSSGIQGSSWSSSGGRSAVPSPRPAARR
jgi:hypothetical protein